MQFRSVHATVRTQDAYAHGHQAGCALWSPLVGMCTSKEGRLEPQYCLNSETRPLSAQGSFGVSVVGGALLVPQRRQRRCSKSLQWCPQCSRQVRGGFAQKLESFFFFVFFAALILAVIGNVMGHVNVHTDSHLISCAS